MWLLMHERSITHIIGDVVDRLYDQNLGFRPLLPMSEALGQISQLCWTLAQWQDNLPTRLKIITSRDAVDDVPPTLENVRLRVLLSLRCLGAKILVLRPVLNQFLDLPGTTASNEHQLQWLRSSGAVLLADIVCTCTDVLHIGKNIILAASRNDQNLLGAWWFSCYYSMFFFSMSNTRGSLTNWGSIQLCPRSPGSSPHQKDAHILS